MKSWLCARKGFGHLRNRGLSLGWRSWVAYLEQVSVMRRSLAGFRNGGLKRGFNAWYAWVEARYEMLELMRRGAGGVLGGPLNKAFNTWADRMSAPDPLRKAVAYFVSRALVAAWIEMKREAETYRTVRRAMAALFNREKKKGMNAWADWYAEVKARRERMRTVLAGFKGGLRKAFNKWAHVLELLTPLRAGLNRLIYRNLSKAFESWQAMYEEALLMKRALGAVLHAPLKRGLQQLKMHADEGHRERDLQRRALMGATPQGKAFHHWSSLLDGLLPLRRAMTHWRSMQIVKALRSWEGMWLQRCLMRRAAAALFGRACRASLNAWMAFVNAKAAMEAKQRAALRKMSPEGRAMSKALNCWCEFKLTPHSAHHSPSSSSPPPPTPPPSPPLTPLPSTPPPSPDAPSFLQDGTDGRSTTDAQGGDGFRPRRRAQGVECLGRARRDPRAAARAVIPRCERSPAESVHPVAPRAQTVEGRRKDRQPAACESL